MVQHITRTLPITLTNPTDLSYNIPNELFEPDTLLNNPKPIIKPAQFKQETQNHIENSK